MSLISNSNQNHKGITLDGDESWVRLVFALAISTFGGIGLWSAVVVMPTIELEFGIDRSDASIPYTATMIGFGVGGVIMGRLVDRYGIFGPLILSSVILGFGYIAASQVSSLLQFIIIQAVLIGMLGSSITLGPLIADTSLWFLKKRGIAVSIVASGNYLAGTIWPPILQFLIDDFGWRQAHLIVGLICLIVMIPLSFAFRASSPIEQEVGDQKTGNYTNHSCISPEITQILLIFAGICCCVAMSMPQVHIVAYCGELGYGTAVGAELLSLMLGVGIISRIIFGIVADKIGGIRTLILGSMLQCIGLILYLLSTDLTSLYLVTFFFGLAQGGIVPSYALIVRDYFPPQEAASRVSLVMMSTIVGMAFGGWLTGEIFDFSKSYTLALFNGVIFNILNILIALWLLLGPKVWAIKKS